MVEYVTWSWNYSNLTKITENVEIALFNSMITFWNSLLEKYYYSIFYLLCVLHIFQVEINNEIHIIIKICGCVCIDEEALLKSIFIDF